MKTTLKPLKDQVIVITGPSSGIGLVTAIKAAKKGAKLVLASRNEAALQELSNEINSKGGRAIYVKADVGNQDDVNRIAETAINAFGRFDTWVNNAGVSIFGSCEEVSIEDMKRMFDTNYWGTVYGSRAAVKHFKENGTGGALINVGSFFGDRATPVQSTYCAAKHAVHGWTDALRMELEKEKAPISVTLIHPGRIDTPYNEHAQSYQKGQPVHKGIIYAPETVAEAILYSAAHPKRDIFVGFQAKFFAIMGKLAPALMDKIMEAIIYPTQESERPSKSREESGLYKPGYGMQERGTHEPWIMRNVSLNVKAAKHPMLTASIVAALAGGAYLAVRTMRNTSIKNKSANPLNNIVTEPVRQEAELVS